MKRPSVLTALFTIYLCAAPVSNAILYGGRALETNQTFYVGVRYGWVTTLDGKVEETKRAGDTTPGYEQSYGKYLEKYDFSELGLNDSYDSIGFFLEKQGRLFTFQFDMAHTTAEGSGVADREPFALGVEKVVFDGQEYEYMLIPQGDAYDIEIDTYIFNARLLLTPFHFAVKDSFSLSPWVYAGIYALTGEYEIDAGPAQGVTTYEYHPYDYVIGGKGTGSSGLALPEFGFGAEMKIAVGTSKGETVDLVLRGEYGTLQWDFKSGDIGIESRNEKNVDLDYTTYEFTAMLEYPMSKEVDLVLGVTYRSNFAKADIEAQHRDVEEQDALKEKYDKYVEYEMETVYGIFGLKF